jgi:DNA polymerase
MAGPAGQLLDRMMASIGLDRSSVMVINLIPWRPPGGRPPTEAEIAMCLPFLRRHLVLLRPRIVVSLGALPCQVLSGSDATIRRLRGKWQKIVLPGMADSVAVVAITHPAALLRTPAAKKDAWSDLLALQQAVKSECFQDVRT